MSLTKLSLARKNLIVSGHGKFSEWHPSWDGKIANFFYSVCLNAKQVFFSYFLFKWTFAITQEKNKKTNNVFSWAELGSEAPAIGWRPRGVVRVREDFAIREENKTNNVFSLAKQGSEAPAIGWRPRGVVRVREDSLPAS